MNEEYTFYVVDQNNVGTKISFRSDSELAKSDDEFDSIPLEEEPTLSEHETDDSCTNTPAPNKTRWCSIWLMGCFYSIFAAGGLIGYLCYFH